MNILRTAPFKAIHFYSYEKYRDHLLKITGNEEATNIERFVAGAAAGITATVLCIPMDTVSDRYFRVFCSVFLIPCSSMSSWLSWLHIFV